MVDVALVRARSPLWERVWRAYLPLLVLWVAFYLAVDMMVAPYGSSAVIYDPMFLQVYIGTTKTFLMGAVIYVFFKVMVFGADVPRGERIRRAWQNASWPELLGLGTIPPLIFLFTTMRIFKSYKPHLPDIVPFNWDPEFITLDRMLFGGYDGWEWTHAFLYEPWMTASIDRLYVLWFPIVITCVCATAVSPLNSKTRLTFLMTFILNWGIVGCLFATVFSSAGPVFVNRISEDTSFVPMLLRLREIHATEYLFTVEGIDFLWEGHVGVEGVVPFGITAFPSLHVCISALIYYYLRACSRVLGWLGFVFLALILLGSVHLGWHYLVDGIAGIALCYVHWKLSWRFAEWWLRDVA